MSDITGRCVCVCVYLQEAVSVLQQVESTVAAVVLLRDSTAAALHTVGGEETRCTPPHLPLHLQVAADTDQYDLLIGEERSQSRGEQQEVNSLSDQPADVLVVRQLQRVHYEDTRPAEDHTHTLQLFTFIAL